MSNLAKCKKLMEQMQQLITFLNDDEISDISLVLLRATDRMLTEQEGE